MPQIVGKIPPTELLPLFIGKTTEIILPSHRKVEVRETNGDDDDILSSLLSSNDGSNVYNFLAAIVLKDRSYDPPTKPTVADIENWPINDKYGLLFKHRIWQYGYELKFRAICPECDHEDTYVEDLNRWDADLSKPVEHNKTKSLTHYPMGNQQAIELVISSGKKLKYKILTGVLERRALELKDSTKNSPLIIRELELENQSQFIQVKHFGIFSGKEMLEIRSNLKKNDPQFDPMVNWNCSNRMCNKEFSISLFQISAFFYPEEIL